MSLEPAEVGPDDDQDMNAWAQAIDEVLRNRETAFQRAVKFREALQHLRWDVAADNFIEQLIQLEPIRHNRR